MKFTALHQVDLVLLGEHSNGSNLLKPEHAVAAAGGTYVLYRENPQAH